MDKYFSQTVGIPVVTEFGQKVGRVFDVIINTDNGKVVGFLVSSSGHKVIAPVDILTWDHALYIHDFEDILEVDEIHSVREAMRKGIRVWRSRVVTKSGENLGHVVDFMMHDKLFVLTKIVVAKSFLGLINYRRRVIAHKDILEIKKDRIIVKDPLRPIPVKSKMKVRAGAAASV